MSQQPGCFRLELGGSKCEQGRQIVDDLGGHLPVVILTAVVDQLDDRLFERSRVGKDFQGLGPAESEPRALGGEAFEALFGNAAGAFQFQEHHHEQGAVAQRFVGVIEEDGGGRSSERAERHHRRELVGWRQNGLRGVGLDERGDGGVAEEREPERRPVFHARFRRLESLPERGHGVGSGHPHQRSSG